MESRRNLLKVGIWYALFNAILINIIGYKYLQMAPVGQPLQYTLYFYFFSFSYLTVISLLPILFVYLPVVMLAEDKKKACKIWGALAYTIYLIIITIDSFVFSLYRFHLNHTVIEQIAGPGAGQVFEIPFITYIIAIIVLTAFFFIEIFLFNVAYKLCSKDYNKTFTILVSTIVSVLIVTQIIHAVAAAEGNRHITCYDKMLPLCKPLNINSLLTKIGCDDIPQKPEVEFSGKKYKYPLNEIVDSCTNTNVLFIVLDSWTSNTLDSTICPNIYKFSKECSVFTNHYSNGNCTRNGLFSIMYGIPGTCWYDFRDQNIKPVLIKEMEKYDYDVSLYPSASLKNPPFDKNAFYGYENQCEATTGDKAWQRDAQLTKNFITYIKSRTNTQRPFFSLLFFDSLHSMFIPDSFNVKFKPTWTSPEYMNLGPDTDPTAYKNLYKNMVNYLDFQFAKVIEVLKEKNLLKNTIIIVTGDHGQEFNENKKNFWGHNGNFSEYQIHVPLLYYSPTHQPQTYNHWSIHQDIVPTLMKEVFNVQNPISDYSTGKSLFDTSVRDHIQFDGYNGLGTIKKDGTIEYVLFDGDYEILNKGLDDQLDLTLNKKLYEEVLENTSHFYTK